jgi:hypothetical protein
VDVVRLQLYKWSPNKRLSARDRRFLSVGVIASTPMRGRPIFRLGTFVTTTFVTGKSVTFVTQAAPVPAAPPARIDAGV